MTDKIKPRKSDIVIQDLNSETLIYDLKKNKALCLNETASKVWRLCDGNRSVAEISQIMSKQLNSFISEDVVWLALDQLKKEELLENAEALEPRFEGLSRREAIKKIGFASMIALPLISAVIAPTALQAQSGGCTENGIDFCVGAQQDVNDCVDAISPLEMTVCCGGTFTVITFDNPLGSNSCCGTCGPRIG